MIIESVNGMDRGKLQEESLDALRAAITSGQYLPGDQLGEVELATHLGVSRTTVRQALRDLQQEGLVTAGNGSMFRVINLSSREVRELLRVGAALEGLAVRQMMASPDVEASLMKLREALSGLAEADLDWAGRVEADIGFHRQLCQLSGNSMLVESWRFLEGRIRLAIMTTGPEQAQTVVTRNGYKNIIDAIESADCSVAVTAVNDHMSAAADNFAQLTS